MTRLFGALLRSFISLVVSVGNALKVSRQRPGRVRVLSKNDPNDSGQDFLEQGIPRGDVNRTESIVEKQPRTQITFNEKRVGEEGISEDLDDREITTNLNPRITAQEERRFDIFSSTSDLKGVPAMIKSAVARMRQPKTDRIDLTEELRRDRHSSAGRRFQAAVRSKIAAASMRGVPFGSAYLVTIDLGAFPSLSDWLAAGGASPSNVVSGGMIKVNEALDAIGCVHFLMEGFFEIAHAKNVDLDDDRRAQFVKSFAETWPKSLKLCDHQETIIIPHFHWVMVLLDEAGVPIPGDRLAEELRVRFPATRAIRVEPIHWGTGTTYREVMTSGAAAALRYAIKAAGEKSDYEIEEQARWFESLEPEVLWTTGWHSTVDVRPSAVPIMRASLLARSKLRDAFSDVEIGRGWAKVERKPAVTAKIIYLVTPSPDRHVGHHSGVGCTPANDNYPDLVRVRCRDGPVALAA